MFCRPICSQPPISRAEPCAGSSKAVWVALSVAALIGAAAVSIGFGLFPHESAEFWGFVSGGAALSLIAIGSMIALACRARAAAIHLAPKPGPRPDQMPGRDSRQESAPAARPKAETQHSRRQSQRERVSGPGPASRRGAEMQPRHRGYGGGASTQRGAAADSSGAGAQPERRGQGGGGSTQRRAAADRSGAEAQPERRGHGGGASSQGLGPTGRRVEDRGLERLRERSVPFRPPASVADLAPKAIAAGTVQGAHEVADIGIKIAEYSQSTEWFAMVATCKALRSAVSGFLSNLIKEAVEQDRGISDEGDRAWLKSMKWGFLRYYFESTAPAITRHRFIYAAAREAPFQTAWMRSFRGDVTPRFNSGNLLLLQTDSQMKLYKTSSEGEPLDCIYPRPSTLFDGCVLDPKENNYAFYNGFNTTLYCSTGEAEYLVDWGAPGAAAAIEGSYVAFVSGSHEMSEVQINLFRKELGSRAMRHFVDFDNRRPSDLFISNSRLVSVYGKKNCVYVRDLRESAPRALQLDHGEGNDYMKAVCDQERVVTVSSRSIKVWGIATGEQMKSIPLANLDQLEAADLALRFPLLALSRRQSENRPVSDLSIIDLDSGALIRSFSFSGSNHYDPMLRRPAPLWLDSFGMTYCKVTGENLSIRRIDVRPGRRAEEEKEGAGPGPGAAAESADPD